MEADAARLRDELHALGDQRGADRAALEVAKLRFFSGHGASALELGQQLWATIPVRDRMRDELLGWIAAFAYWGPMPVTDALELMDELAVEVRASLWAENRIVRCRAALLAEQGRFDEARSQLEAALRSAEELGAGYVIAALKGMFMGPVELLAGNAPRAAEFEIAGYQQMSSTGFAGFANTVAAHLAQAMLAMDRDEEAEHWATVARETGTGDDPAAIGPALGVSARVLARRGAFDEAERLGQEAIASFDGTDYIDWMAGTHADLADVLRLAGRFDEASDELGLALQLYERKGHLVGAGQIRLQLDELTASAGDTG
jgi:tetratricopeptide (TPR) repeat protein